MKEIRIPGGTIIDEALGLLKEEERKAGEPCFGEFNGKEIYSTDTVDEIYMKILYKTKAEFEEWQRSLHGV